MRRPGITSGGGFAVQGILGRPGLSRQGQQMPTISAAPRAKSASIHAKPVRICGRSLNNAVMRHLNTLLAVLTLTTTGASAQSVLERVLDQIDGASNLAQVSGVYANIASSAGAYGTVTPGITTTQSVAADFSTAPAATILWVVADEYVRVSDVGTIFDAGDGTVIGNALPVGGRVIVNADGSITVDPGAGTISTWNPSKDINLDVTGAPQSLTLAEVAFVYDLGLLYLVSPEVATRYVFSDSLLYVDVTTTTEGALVSSLSTTIDGAITNIITGVASATAESAARASTATAFSLPMLDLGDMATTALGAVNTGKITLGVKAAVDEAATTTTRALSATMTQIGGSADTGALVLNVAHNASAVNGAIQNTVIAVNGAIGSASTTALGAVNTGTILSGVDAALQGIVGMSGQTTSGL